MSCVCIALTTINTAALLSCDHHTHTAAGGAEADRLESQRRVHRSQKAQDRHSIGIDIGIYHGTTRAHTHLSVFLGLSMRWWCGGGWLG